MTPQTTGQPAGSSAPLTNPATSAEREGRPSTSEPVLGPVGAHGELSAHEEALVRAIAEHVAALTSSQPTLMAYNVEQACRALGVSWDFWTAHIAPDVRIVRRGAKKLIPVSELKRWLDENAETVLPGPRVARTLSFAGDSRPVGADTPVSRKRAA